MGSKYNWRREGIDGKEPYFLKRDLALQEKRKIKMHTIRLEPNTKYPGHKHSMEEWVYVLEGDMSDQRGTYEKGDFLINEINSEHQITSGSEGTEILVVKFLENN